MGIITKAYSFGADECLTCGKKMREKRKYKDFCSVPCQRRGAEVLNKRLDNMTLANIPNPKEPRR